MRSWISNPDFQVTSCVGRMGATVPDYSPMVLYLSTWLSLTPLLATSARLLFSANVLVVSNLVGLRLIQMHVVCTVCVVFDPQA